MDVEVGVASEGAFISFNVAENPTAKAESGLRNFKPSWSSVHDFLVHDEDAKGMFISVRPDPDGVQDSTHAETVSLHVHSSRGPAFLRVCPSI